MAIENDNPVRTETPVAKRWYQRVPLLYVGVAVLIAVVLIGGAIIGW
jgi:hypothetical protein